MAKLVGNRKQKLFFRIVTIGLLCCCTYLIIHPETEKKGDIQKTAVHTNQTSQNTQVTQEPNKQAKESMSNQVKNVKVKGIYVSGPTAGSEKRMYELIHLVETTKLNAMVIDVKNDSGEITYKMNYDTAKEIGATKGYIKDMESLVRELKEKNIYLIARIVTFKDPILANKIPEYSIQNKDGSVFRDNQGFAWLNPYNRNVWKYVLNVATRAAALGFDEIQFDYIRFPTANNMGNVTYGAESKHTSKRELITEFTRCASRLLRGMDVKVSADVFGGIMSSKQDSTNIGQDYSKMAQNLDCICPMLYPSQFAKGCYGVDNPDGSPYEIVYRALKDSQSQLENQNPVTVRPWLQDFTATWLRPHTNYDENKIRTQIEAVYASGYDEWILWNAANKYTTNGID